MFSSTPPALNHVARYASGRTQMAIAKLKQVTEMSAISWQTVESLFDSIQHKASIAVHFHPFRLKSSGKSVLESLKDSGLYKSQFETHISNGLLDASTTGERAKWESRMFGNSLKKENRPKYGALRLLGHESGPSPRFGSCYFVLRHHCLANSTFTYLDSYKERAERGTIIHFWDILASIFEDSFERDTALGMSKLRPPQLIESMHNFLQSNLTSRIQPGNLDFYVEAQIHQPIKLESDVAFLMADASFKNQNYGNRLASLARHFSIPLHWHSGFELHLSEIPPDFRGPQIVHTATHIAQEGKLNAHVLAKAEVDAFQKGGLSTHFLQALKYLWHILVKFGKAVK